ncbi:hypothetical protein JVT61DRAFT_13356 [Boletus reticuloceps]|uniref:Uncharacterized protein n=1 Tax=Boletus reticuloceps TaxID=495285 RepID=A0A8I2YDC1_9AGAM|nr:hypothetical protein JVT61DRAFT_13356 [Boletus reticuloceps]
MPSSRQTSSANPTSTLPSGMPRRSKRNNAGQGGARQQLQKVVDVIEQPQQAAMQRSVIPDDVPPNPMAPTPRCARKTSQKPPKTKKSTKDANIKGSKLCLPLQTAVAASQANCLAFSVPEPELRIAVAGSRFGLQVQASEPPSFVGSQTTYDYEQGWVKYPSRLQTVAEGSSLRQHQSGMCNENSVEGTPARPRATDRQSYADALRLPSPCRPVPQASSATATNRAHVRLQPHSNPLSAIQEHSMMSASEPTTTRLNTDKRIAAQVVPKSQGNVARQCVPVPARPSDVFGGESDLSETSGSEIDHNESLLPKPRNSGYKNDVDEPRAKETSRANKGGPYEDDNEGLYVDDPTVMNVDNDPQREGLYMDDPTDMNVYDDPQRDDLYVNDDEGAGMDVDPHGDEQEFPQNLDDGTSTSTFIYISSDELLAIDSSDDHDEDGDEDGQISRQLY